MVLLATIRKYPLCNGLLCMKRIGQTNLLSSIQLKYDTFRSISTNEDSDRIVLKEEISSVDKPPEKPDIDICCGNGCKNCVWLQYVVAVRFYYGNDKEKLQNALNSIPEPDMKAFVEMELKKAVKSIK